jgi:hypothetical protein
MASAFFEGCEGDVSLTPNFGPVREIIKKRKTGGIKWVSNNENLQQISKLKWR